MNLGGGSTRSDQVEERRWPATTRKSKLTPLPKKKCLRTIRVQQTHPRPRAARLLTPYLTAGARARNRFLKLIGIIGARFSRGKRSDNSAIVFASTDVLPLRQIDPFLLRCSRLLILRSVFSPPPFTLLGQACSAETWCHPPQLTSAQEKG